MTPSEGYQLTRQLGAGATGCVFLAQSGGAPVALRQFQSVFPRGTDEWNYQRQTFLDGAGQARLLNHPNIVPVLEVLEEAGDCFIAAEYVNAPTLDTVAGPNATDTRQALAWLRQIASALDYAHAGGIVHGDLKPSNVFVLPNGVVKVGDFAISPRARREPGSSWPAQLLHPYLSPEHILQPAAIGAASDQYALAAMAYRLLTGATPLAQSGDPLSTAIVRGDIQPPSHYQRGLAATDAVFHRAFAYDPAQRYASCGEFLAYLENALEYGAGRGRGQAREQGLDAGRRRHLRPAGRRRLVPVLA